MRPAALPVSLLNQSYLTLPSRSKPVANNGVKDSCPLKTFKEFSGDPFLSDRHLMPALQSLRRLLDDVSNLFGLRGEDGVAGFDLGHAAASALGHFTLQIGIDGAIFGRHNGPAAFRLPSGILYLGREGFFRGEDLRPCQKRCVLFWQVRGEVLRECGGVEIEIFPVLRLADVHAASRL